jgi:dTDP-4-amino-4,6-dideoxygalactose transaminase
MRIPVLKPTPPLISDFAEYLQKSYDSNLFSNGGPCVKSLEARLSDWIGSDSILMSNATIALKVVLDAMELKGSDILVPSFTFAATACSIIDAGCRPVLVDCDPKTLMMSLDDAEYKITPFTRGIVVVQALGYTCTPEIYERFAEKYGLSLIFDSAASLGAKYPNGRMVGSAGDAEVFSLHITKTFGVGEGGLVTTGNPVVAARCRQLINFGFDSALTSQAVGTNAKMSEYHAAVGLAVLDCISKKLASRSAVAEAYKAKLQNVRFLDSPSAHQVFPVIFDSKEQRDNAAQKLFKQGIGSRIYYKPLHQHPAFNSFVDSLYPNSQRIFDTILCLPMWEGLPVEIIEEISEIINQVR